MQKREVFCASVTLFYVCILLKVSSSVEFEVNIQKHIYKTYPQNRKNLNNSNLQTKSTGSEKSISVGSSHVALRKCRIPFLIKFTNLGIRVLKKLCFNVFMHSMKEAIITAIFGRAPLIYISSPILYLVYSHQTYIFTSGEWYFIPVSFPTFSHFHVQGIRHVGSLEYPGGIFNDSPTLFFILFNFLVGRWTRNENIFDDRLILPLILSSLIFITFSLSLNHHRCLFILRP